MKTVVQYLAVSVLVLSGIYARGGVSTAFAGGTYYVSTTGRDSNNGSLGAPWRTISHAVARVPDNGSTIVVRNGTYNECVVIKRRFSSRMTLKAQNAYRARWQCNRPTHILKVSGARNVTIEGFEFRRPNLSAHHPSFVCAWRAGSMQAEGIIFRNNIFHDTVDSDLLHLGGGARNLVVEGNVFYNQASIDGQHIDVNSAINVDVRDNIFFNDFKGSGRRNTSQTNSYIVIKDSEGRADGILSARNVRVRRNIFLNWQGRERSFVMVGEDGSSYFEAIGVTIENNLMLGNSPKRMLAPITVRGSKDVTVRANTISGNLPSRYYVIASFTRQQNRKNENLRIYNNIWSDPTGTMGGDLSCCGTSPTRSYAFDNNLFYNAGRSFPGSSNPFVKITSDAHRVVGNPQLSSPSNIVVPRWNGSGFNGGYKTIREAFVGLANRYGALHSGSAAINRASAANMPADDILGRQRSARGGRPDIGAFEYQYQASGLILNMNPSAQRIVPGQTARYTMVVRSGSAGRPVSLSIGRVPTGVRVHLSRKRVSVPGTAILSVTSNRRSLPQSTGRFVEVPVTATDGKNTITVRARLLIGGQQTYMPVVANTR